MCHKEGLAMNNNATVLVVLGFLMLTAFDGAAARQSRNFPERGR
jgi:hypothetical protein